MAHKFQNKNSAGWDETSLPVEFITICVLAFIASVPATAYFSHSMSAKMKMPGGWTIAMMWMRMPGSTWLVSTLSFLLMWLVMMVAMMMPSALPMFLKTRRKWDSLCYMACGYFSVWLAVAKVCYIVFNPLQSEDPVHCARTWRVLIFFTIGGEVKKSKDIAPVIEANDHKISCLGKPFAVQEWKSAGRSV